MWGVGGDIWFPCKDDIEFDGRLYHPSPGSASSQGCASAPTLSLSRLCNHACGVNINEIPTCLIDIRSNTAQRIQ